MKKWPDYLPIWIDEDRLGGTPCFVNTRVPVEALFANLEDGMNLEEFLDAFDGVIREHAIAVLEYARQQFRVELITTIAPGDYKVVL